MFHNSVEPLSEAIKLQPNFPHYIHERAKAYLLIGEYVKAECDFNRVIDMQPINSHAYFGRGFAMKGKK